MNVVVTISNIMKVYILRTSNTTKIRENKMITKAKEYLTKTIQNKLNGETNHVNNSSI